jgi:sulfonate transport system substrate-binding protein
MINRRRALAGLLAAPALASGARANAALPAEFRIGFQKSGVLVVARQQGTIERRLKALGVPNVKWVEFQYGPPLMEALGLGSIDFGQVGDTPPVFAQAAGAKVVYAAATPASQSAILVPQDSSIRTLTDLKGRRLAFARGSSSHNFVIQALAKAGLTPADIQQTFLSPADAVAAFSRGSVDAWAVWDPYFAIAEKRHNGRVLTTTKGVLDSYSFYLANRDFAGRHPQTLKAAIEALGETTAWAAANRDKLAAALSEETRVDLDLQKTSVDRQNIEIGPITDAVVQSQQVIADSFHKLGIVPRHVNVRDIIWTAPQS